MGLGYLPEPVAEALLRARGWQDRHARGRHGWVSPAGTYYEGNAEPLRIALTAEVDCEAAYDAIVRGQGE